MNLLILGNATSGGVLPAAYLPRWLQPLSDVLPVGVGVRAIQGMSYFHHDGVTPGVVVLTGWIIACVGLLSSARYARLIGPDRFDRRARAQSIGASD